jgi:hypothetical protein
MKKLLTFLTIFMLVAAFFVAPAQAELRHYVAKVYKQTTERADQLTLITSGITYQVLAVGTDTEETLYSDEARTAMTNVVTTTVFNTLDRIDFYADPTDETIAVDLIITDTNGGFSVFVEDFDPYTHTIVIDERPNILHHGIVPFADVAGTAVDTGVDFLPDTMISLVCVEVVTIDAGQVIGIETVDTVDGFILNQSIGTAGYYCNNKPTITAGGTETIVSTASNVGSLMGSSLAGTQTATDEGSHYNWNHIVTTVGTDDDLYFDTDASASFVAAGYIHYFFMRLR